MGRRPTATRGDQPDICWPIIEAAGTSPDRTRLVGRDAELEAGRQALWGGRRTALRALAVSGEPGIGKSRVAAHLATLAGDDGAIVLEGRAAEFERELPFGVFVDALDDHLRSLSPAAFSRVVGDSERELGALFPALSGPHEGAPGVAEDRAFAHRAVAGMLERIAPLAPLLLVLEDVHWADVASTELIGHLLRRPPSGDIAVLVTYRTGQAGPRLEASLSEAERADLARTLELPALSTDSLAELVADLGVERRAWIGRESGGNPFYALELARGGAAAPSGATSATSPEVPRAVGAAIAVELESLGDPVRRLAEGAAVAGDPFELDIAVAAAGAEPPSALAVLDELVASGLAGPTVVPRRFAFRHPIVRSAIYAEIAPGTRIEMHQSAAELLAARGADARAIAHHAERAAEPGDEAMTATLLEAASASAARAPASAARWYGAAARLLAADDPRRTAILTDRARALTAIGRLDEAEGAISEALAAGSGIDPTRRFELTIELARTEQSLGRVDAALRRLRAALAETGEDSPRTAASIMLAISTAEFYAADYSAMQGSATRALELARSAAGAARPQLAAAASLVAFAAALAGEASTAERAADVAAALVDALSDDEACVELRALTDLAGAELYLDRFAATVAHGERALRLARSSGQGSVVPTLYPALGCGLWLVGRVGESVELLIEAVEGARLVENPQLLPWALFNLAQAAVMSGDFQLASASAEESVELAGRLESGLVTSYAQAGLAIVEIESGDHERGVERMLSQVGGVEISHIAGGWSTFYAEALVRGLIALGRVAEAEQVTVAARERADSIGLPFSDCLAAATEALLAVELRQGERAVERAERSVELAIACGAVADIDFCRMGLARALAVAGRREEAIAEFRRTARSFDAAGQRRFRDEIERDLRALGERVHRRTARDADAAGVASLTGRELEIARLVVDRMTNAEIAAELYLGVKTIETHLRNIFRKLDVSSRVDVARVVEAAGEKRS